MIATTATINQADILGRALELRRSDLSPEVAQFLLAIELSPEDRQHLDLLAERARRGTLSEQEEIDLEEFRRAGRLVEFLKLRARQALLKSP